MPELPEVETLARQLAPLLRGRVIRGCEILDPKLARTAPRALAGRRVRDIYRIGKQVVLELGGGRGAAAPCWLAVHLRMTGRLLWRAAGASGRNGAAHLRARLRLDRGELLFDDARRFGLLRLYDDPAALAAAGGGGRAGLDPLGREFTPRRLAALLAGSRQEIKPWLLRQDRLAGLGNIYAAEALFLARLAPWRAAGMLRPAEVRRLHAAVRRVLGEAIRRGGTTFSNFQDARGRSGEYWEVRRVYAREGEPCPRCRTPLRRLVQQQRGTWYCPRCQGTPRRRRGRG